MALTLIHFLCITVVSAAKSGVKGDGYVGLPVRRVSNASNSSFAVSDKFHQDIAIAGLTGGGANDVYSYVGILELGNPGQEQHVAIDTGSSDLWVWGKDSGAPGDTYDPSKSSESKFLNDGFSVGYISGDDVSGDYYSDKMQWDNVGIDVQFGVANKYNQGDGTTGIIGIGFEGSEGSRDGPYPNLPAALKEQGLIFTVSYSIFLDEIDANSGLVLFGAVDTSLFHGKLTVIEPFKDGVPFSVNGYSSNATLDSGTSLVYLPQDILEGVIDSSFKNEVVFDQSSSLYCRQKGQDLPEGNVTFTFNDVDIVMGKDELWLQNGDVWCLGFLASKNIHLDNWSMLGDYFLRSAYVVLDLEDDKMGIAPANYNGGPASYEMISNGVIPSSE